MNDFVYLIEFNLSVAEWCHDYIIDSEMFSWWPCIRGMRQEKIVNKNLR